MTSLLGVDGGNTKTIALVATGDGTIVGAGRAGCSDVHMAVSEHAALSELDRAVDAALRQAGASPRDLLSAAFCMAGADWPADYEFVRAELRKRGFGPSTIVENDVVGALRAGTGDGVGVVVALGTGSAIGARNSNGDTWCAGFWQQPLGGAEIGRKAVQAACRAELGIDPPTQLSQNIAAHFNVADIDDVLRCLYVRQDWSEDGATMSALAPLVFDAAAEGDSAARSIIDDTGRIAADFIGAAARKVGLKLDETAVVLAGGLFRHESDLLGEAIRRHAQVPPARLVRNHNEPALGALMLALEAAGIAITPTVAARIEITQPPASMFATRPDAMPAAVTEPKAMHPKEIHA